MAEDSLVNAIGIFGENTADNVAKVQRSCDVLADDKPAKDALKQFVSDWRCEWNSNTGNTGRNTMLKFVSYQVLPPVLVSFFRSYVRVTDDSYEIVTAFTMDGYESADAAMCIKGKREKSSGNVCKFKPDQVRVVESDAVTTLSRDMLDAAGLSRFTKWQPIKSTNSTHVEIEHISEKLVLFRTQPGVRWVCKRLSGGMSDCIPFKI